MLEMFDVMNVSKITYYYIPLVISLMGMIRVTRLNIRQDKGVLYFREFIQSLCLTLFAFYPLLNAVMAFMVLWYFLGYLIVSWWNFLDRFAKVVIWRR